MVWYEKILLRKRKSWMIIRQPNQAAMVPIFGRICCRQDFAVGSKIFIREVQEKVTDQCLS